MGGVDATYNRIITESEIDKLVFHQLVVNVHDVTVADAFDWLPFACKHMPLPSNMLYQNHFVNKIHGGHSSNNSDSNTYARAVSTITLMEVAG